MKFIWLGHGSMRIESGDAKLLIDPWLTGNPVLPEDRHDEIVLPARVGVEQDGLTKRNQWSAGTTLDDAPEDQLLKT